MIPGDTQFLHAGSVTSDVASEILGFLKLADGQGVMHHVQAKALALVLTSLLSKQDEFTTMGADSDEFKQWMASLGKKKKKSGEGKKKKKSLCANRKFIGKARRFQGLSLHST